MCPICRISRAMKEINVAHDAWSDYNCEQEMALAHLRSELVGVLAEPWWRLPWRQRARLREAVDATSGPSFIPHDDGDEATP